LDRRHLAAGPRLGRSRWSRRDLLSWESAQPPHTEPPQQAQGKRRRLSRPLHATRQSGQGQRVQLDAGSREHVHPDAAAVLV